MTEQEARRRAEDARAGHVVDPQWPCTGAEQRFIELVGADREQPSPVRDLLVWVVRFGGEFSWVDLAVSDSTGEVVRMERSR